MRALVQRVSRAAVHTDGDHLLTEIGPGLLVLVGVHIEDTAADASYVCDKLANLRIFPDEDGQMNLSVLDVGGAVLVVSQFTLYADTRRGRRPSFVQAARPDVAQPLVDAVASGLSELGLQVETGEFGAHMDVELINNGPVTVMIETA